MRIRGIAALVLMLAPLEAGAALPIELEVSVEPGAPPGAMQSWARALGEADLLRMRIRGSRRGDAVGVTTVELGPTKRYQIVGVLQRNNVLHLPGGSFRLRDIAKLKKFFAELPSELEHNAAERGRFGLTQAQFKQVFAALSERREQKLQGVAAATAYAKLTAGLPVPVVINTAARAKIDKAPPVGSEIGDLARGAALAAALKQCGLMFYPEQPRGGELQIRVVRYDARRDHWPVGWKPQVLGSQLLPRLYEFKTIEIDGYTLDVALKALQPYVGAPLLFDQWVLAREKQDPLTRQVKHPRKKTYIRGAINGVLSQARLASEIRVDEAGQPFLWITKFGKDSPHAVE